MCGVWLWEVGGGRCVLERGVLPRAENPPTHTHTHTRTAFCTAVLKLHAGQQYSAAVLTVRERLWKGTCQV